LDFGQTRAQSPMGVQASTGENHEGRAAATQVLLKVEHGVLACRAAILQQQKHKLPEALKEGGKQ